MLDDSIAVFTYYFLNLRKSTEQGKYDFTLTFGFLVLVCALHAHLFPARWEL